MSETKVSRRGRGEDAIYFAAAKNRYVGSVSLGSGPDGNRIRRKVFGKTKQEVRDSQAPVRLGGLYALERLAQDNPAQRPTIVNVICAYLRMPFPFIAPASAAADDGAEPAAETEATVAALNDGAWHQERQVRLAAQRILSEHLRKPVAPQQPDGYSGSHFWPGIRLDLTGATLIDFSLADSVVAEARFDEATFTGTAEFSAATFTSDAGFAAATFTADAQFGGAVFNGPVRFGAATFNHAAEFRGAAFTSDARFGRTIFKQGAVFAKAAFNHAAGFDEATFEDVAEFGVASFAGVARFDRVAFDGDAQFGRATFASGPDAIRFIDARVRSSDGSHVWPTGWHLSDDGTGTGGLTLIRANGSG